MDKGVHCKEFRETEYRHASEKGKKKLEAKNSSRVSTAEIHHNLHSSSSSSSSDRRAVVRKLFHEPIIGGPTRGLTVAIDLKTIRNKVPFYKKNPKQRNVNGHVRSSADFTGVATSLKRLSLRSKIRTLIFNKHQSKQPSKMKRSCFLTCSQASHMELDEVVRKLDVDLEHGLTKQELNRRRDIHGVNEVAMPDPDPIWKKYLDQFNNPLIYLLLGSALISTCMGQFDDAISITAAIVIVVTVGFVQEYRSEKTLERMGALLPPTCNVLRDGRIDNMLAKHLVPGDVVHLTVGDRIPADLRMFQVNELGVDESSLTGEPLTKIKKCEKVLDRSEEICHMDNICFQGTLVTEGKGIGVVVATGEHSQFGEIFSKMQSEESPRSPLQKSMDTLGKQLSAYSLAVIAFIMAVGCWQGRPVLEMFNVGVSLAVAAIPEGLPVVVTVTLAFGVMRMARRNAIIKRLPTVEALGCIDVICSDKTGTLTMNDMQVNCEKTAGNIIGDQMVKTLTYEQVEDGNKSDSVTLLEVAVVCNNAPGHAKSSATERALLSYGESRGVSATQLNEKTYSRIGEIPFNSERKYMVVQCRQLFDGQNMYFMKGALEEVLKRCKFALVHGEETEITEPMFKEFIWAEKEMGAKGLRVVAMAKGSTKDAMAFVGMVGLQDPLRPRAASSVQLMLASKVQVCMITGDGKETASETARNLGLLDDFHNKGRDILLSGSELESMSDKDLELTVDKVCVYYRTNPLHKLRIVKALQKNGHIVGMTGDGVNDGVAIKSSDVGISMGKNGTDVCKEAGDFILLDDDFSTILAAIEEGKCIFNNIQSFVAFQLSTSIAALMLISITTLLDIPNPLNPMQILWINIIMDGPPAQSLGFEPVDHNVLKKPPRKVKEQILTRSLLTSVITSALIITTGTMWVLRSTMEDGQFTTRDTTMTFTCFVFFDMFNALASRSQERSIFEVGLLSNAYFCVAVGLSIIGQMAVIYFPPLQYVFQTEPLAASDLLFLLALSSTVFIVSEMRKQMVLRLDKGKSFTNHKKDKLLESKKSGYMV